MFDQVENFKSAILKKRAQVEEIRVIISRPLPKGGSARQRRNLIEEKLHLELAILNSFFASRILIAASYRRKTNELAEEMHKRSRQAKNQISFETARSGNSAAYLQRLFDFHEELSDEWAARLFIPHCEAWVEQNRSISPSFIRAVSNRRIRELFAAHASSSPGVNRSLYRC